MASWRLKSGLRGLLGKQPFDAAEPDEISQEVTETVSVTRSAPLGDHGALWAGAVPIAGRKYLPPDPRMMRAIGLNHSFESAVADIVDNSIDANASKVLIRFIRDRDRLLSLCIVDNGDGMDEATIDRAMTVGGQRTYDGSELGHFGIGLKAASLGQAKILTVVSRPKGQLAVGRRWLIESASKGFECDTLPEDFAASALDRGWDFLTPASGTLVMWSQVKSFPKIAHGNSVDRYVDEELTRLRQHLGVVFHRLISARAIEIAVDAEDVGVGEIGLRFPVEPINPCGYLRSGRRDYPRSLKTNWRDTTVELRCHIWPGRSNHPNFRLPGGRPDQFQGLFVYRNSRLLQIGGWNGIVHASRDLQLARVELDIGPGQDELYSMNAEKTRVETSAELSALLEAASDGDVRFVKYIEDAKSTYRESQKRKRERPKVVAPGKGLAEAIRDAVSEEYDFLQTDQPLAIRWVNLKGDAFFDIDKDQMLIRLNQRYRSAIIGEKGSSLNDAPLIKALIYLLAEETFRGTLLSAKAKDKISVWQSILTAAAQAEVE
jgi:hypothetical protein